MRFISSLAALLGASLLVATPAAASVLDRGLCTDGSRLLLEVDDAGRNGRTLVVEVELTTGQRGETWSFEVVRNGTVMATTTAVTRTNDGEIDLRGRLRNAPGADLIEVFAENTATGEACQAVVTWTR